MRPRHIATIRILTIGVALLLSGSCVVRAGAFDESDLLGVRIRPTAIKGESIGQALELLPDAYGIPLGIELGDDKLSPRRKVNLDLPETNLKDFLDALIAKDPRYTWKLEG